MTVFGALHRELLRLGTKVAHEDDWLKAMEPWRGKRPAGGMERR
ncbi:hypothetical protein HMPREF9946_01792 [Acetobacteraceae bacterium AT-5844]|nr:hypothetical protein HMPREF9946_01792 [Acetobacteraceae bacterium AT-5844]